MKQTQPTRVQGFDTFSSLYSQSTLCVVAINRGETLFGFPKREGSYTALLATLLPEKEIP